MKIIGISGRKGFGKSTAAGILYKILRRKENLVIVDSFASPIRTFVSSYLHIPLEDTYTKKEVLIKLLNPSWEGLDVGEMTLRQFMQGFGTEACRSWISNLWVQHMAMKIAQRESQGVEYLIIDDVRFSNESALCDYVILLDRDLPTDDQHESEQEFESLSQTFHIANNGTIKDLDDRLRGVVATCILG